MKTQDVVNNLLLMANTIEDLEIDNIIACGIGDGKMTCHLRSLEIPNIDATWTPRENSGSLWAWTKSCTHNNIEFFALYTQENYEKEQAR